jgi:hypothetical protein
MKTVITFLMAVSVLFTSGCATIFSGTTARVKVEGDLPPGAKIFYNGQFMGNAPCMVRVNKKGLNKGLQKIVIKADGYKDQEIVLVGKIKVGAVIGNILLGILPLGIDFLTGAVYKPDSPVRYSLDKQ